MLWWIRRVGQLTYTVKSFSAYLTTENTNGITPTTGLTKLSLEFRRSGISISTSFGTIHWPRAVVVSLPAHRNIWYTTCTQDRWSGALLLKGSLADNLRLGVCTLGPAKRGNESKLTRVWERCFWQIRWELVVVIVWAFCLLIDHGSSLFPLTHTHRSVV